MLFRVVWGCCFAVLMLSMNLTGRCDETDDVILMSDRFDDISFGPLSDVVGAHLEYHYLPIAAPKGQWSVSTFPSSIPFQRAWRIVEHQGHHAVLQTFDNTKFKHTHPLLTAGDPAWTDFSVDVKF
ncbi:MAG: hypothetical protein FJ267_12850, partial [Planctomycetes bacterium]|nr:hypothetical protein [Planctomycetota bacterium]